MKLIELQEKLNESGLTVFSALEFRRLMGISGLAAQKLLERYTKKGVLARLKPGLFVLKIKMPSPYTIANRLYTPSYLSFETALAYYRLIPETVYSYTSATTKATREFTPLGQHYYYHKIKKQAFTGYQLSLIAGTNTLLAEKEKALADYLYLVFLKKKKLNDRLTFKNVKTNKLLKYAALFEKAKFGRWVKCLMKNN